MSLPSILENQIKSGDVHHAYIFEGPLTADKENVARAFAMALLCREAPGTGCGKCSICRKIKDENHLDVNVLRAEPSKHSKVLSVRDEAVDQMIERLKVKPSDGDRNIAVICDGDIITPRAANRLLKTLEEPPVGTVIVILSENINNLPDTIRSRCQHIRIMSDNSSDGKYSDKAKKIVELLAGYNNYSSIKKEIDKIDSTKEEAFVFLDSMEDAYREELLKISSSIKREQIFKAVSEIEIARNKIKRNINVKYTLKSMVLAIGG